MTETIIHMAQAVDSAGSVGSLLVLSRVSYWADDPARRAHVWLVESESPRGETVHTSASLRAFAEACLAALDADGQRMSSDA